MSSEDSASGPSASSEAVVSALLPCVPGLCPAGRNQMETWATRTVTAKPAGVRAGRQAPDVNAYRCSVVFIFIVSTTIIILQDSVLYCYNALRQSRCPPDPYAEALTPRVVHLEADPGTHTPGTQQL